MAYDLEEQEQLDEFKAWWKQHGRLISRVFIALLVSYAAYQAWHYYQNKQSVAGSSLYQELVVTDPKDLKSILAKSASLMEDYSGTPYAGRAALMAAKANYQAKQVASAKAQLEWAAKHASEASVEALANLQLASILALIFYLSYIDLNDFEKIYFENNPNIHLFQFLRNITLIYFYLLVVIFVHSYY